MIFSPAATRTEVNALYPEADIEALREVIARRATAAEARELLALIQAVLADSPDEWSGVHQIACADADAALACYRALARCLAEPISDRKRDPTTTR